MRKRKLYLNELLKRCKRKTYEIYINDIYVTLYFKNILEAIKQIDNSIYWDCEIKYWEVNENQLQIYL